MCTVYNVCMSVYTGDIYTCMQALLKKYQLKILTTFLLAHFTIIVEQNVNWEKKANYMYTVKPVFRRHLNIPEKVSLHHRFLDMEKVKDIGLRKCPLITGRLLVGVSLEDMFYCMKIYNGDDVVGENKGLACGC